MTTQTAQHDAEIVRRAYEAFDTADIALLTELMDERMTWHTPGRSPLAGDTRNREETFAQDGRYGGGSAGTFRAEFRTAAIDRRRPGDRDAPQHGPARGPGPGRRLLHRVRGRGRPGVSCVHPAVAAGMDARAPRRRGIGAPPRQDEPRRSASAGVRRACRKPSTTRIAMTSARLNDAIAAQRAIVAKTENP